MTTNRRKVRSTDKLARAYDPRDPRYERNARLGGMRERAQRASVEAAVAQAEQAAAAVADTLVMSDFAGTSFPVGPIDGQPFTRTDLDAEMFVWDETRDAWLSTSRIMVTFSAQTLVAAGGFLRLFQAPTTSATLGFSLPYDATLVEVVATRVTSGAATQFDIRAAGVVKKSHTLGAGVVVSSETAINVSFTSADIVNVIMNSDLTGGGTITCHFRRRST